MEQNMPFKFHTTVFQLKIIAMVSMFTDHAAFVFVKANTPLYLVMRGFGRLAFPIYCFLLVEGFYHTRNVKSYIVRLGFFALISEIPFNLAFANGISYPGHQNTLFTLLIGMSMLAAIDYFKKKGEEILIGASLIGFSMMAFLLKTDYDAVGIIMIFAFYEYRNRKMIQALLVGILGLISGGLEVLRVFAFVPIFAYNGEKGRGGLKYFFYLFYPAHLLVLYMIRRMI